MLPKELISREILERFILINFRMPEQIEQTEQMVKPLIQDNFDTTKPINLVLKYVAKYNGAMSVCDLALEGANLYTGNSDNDYTSLVTSFVNVGLIFKYLHPAFAMAAPINLGVNLYYGTQNIEDFSYIATQSIAIGMLKFMGAETVVSLAFSAAITLSVINKAIELYNNLMVEEAAQGIINIDVVNNTTSPINSFDELCSYEEYKETTELGSVVNTEDIL